MEQEVHEIFSLERSSQDRRGAVMIAPQCSASATAGFCTARYTASQRFVSIRSSGVSVMPIDKKAQRILFDTYWSPRGRKRDLSADPVGFAYARRAGYMFDAIELTHDAIVKQLLAVRGRISLREVADAFVASLSTRRLDLRSALGSFAFASHFPDHRLAEETSTRVPSGRLYCHICGLYGGPRADREDLNILSFERFKWGGVRHSKPLYCSFDLAQFETADRLFPTVADYLILAKIIQVATSLAPSARANSLEKGIAKLVRSNPSERRVLIECLAHCGVLKPSGRSGFLQAFTSAEDRNHDRPHDSKNDWSYPAIWWRGVDGVNHEALALCFPSLAAMI